MSNSDGDPELQKESTVLEKRCQVLKFTQYKLSTFETIESTINFLS
jgi:hypothetical protein